MPEIIVQSTPGAIVPAGALITPGGAGGPPGTPGGGDMYKSTYDKSNRGYADQAAYALGGPLASAAGSGFMSAVTGVITDYVGGDNACHNLAAGVRTQVGLATPSLTGLSPVLGNTGANWQRDDGVWAIPSRYYGADTTNNGAYAITVASDFSLTPGVVVWATLSFVNSAANPSLNVNGSGAKPFINRANLALNQYEIRPSTLGAVYDGTSWRVFTPLIRGISLGNALSGTYSLNCAGFDGINFYGGLTAAGTLALQNVGYGVPITIRIYASVAATYMVTVTNPAGIAQAVYWAWSNAVGGAALVRIDNASQSMAAGNQLFMTGCLEFAGTVMLL